MSQDKQVALVTGGNRGIGYELVKQLALKGFKTILASRDLNKGHIAAQNLMQTGLDVSFALVSDDWARWTPRRILQRWKTNRLVMKISY